MPFVSPTTGVRHGPVTISMGICMAADADSADDLYAKVDRALYRSKIAGWNRVTKFSTIRDQPLKSWMLYQKG
jgi:diguanylate cyclase